MVFAFVNRVKKTNDFARVFIFCYVDEGFLKIIKCASTRFVGVEPIKNRIGEQD